jgi:hypothetical protein
MSHLGYARAKLLDSSPARIYMEELIDRIYEAAALPEFWPAVLDELTAAGSGFATICPRPDGCGTSALSPPSPLREQALQANATEDSLRPDFLAIKRNDGFPEIADIARKTMPCSASGHKLL